MSNFYVIDYKEEKLGVLDKSDGVVEYYSINDIKSFILDGIVINGVVLDENTNPIYTLKGLKVDLAYPIAKKVGKWIITVLKIGDKYGSTLVSSVKKPTVRFYDSSVKWSKQEHPYGQFVASYHLDTLLNHQCGLYLDASVPSWYVEESDMKVIVNWLREVSSKIGV